MKEKKSMVKLNKMKAIYFIIPFLFSSIMLSQSKAFFPQKGSITFTKETVISDEDEYWNSLEKMKSEIAEALLKSLNAEQKIDASKLESIKDKISMAVEISFAQGDDDESKYTFHYVSDGSTIKSYKTQDDLIVGDFMLIDPKNSMYVWLAKADSTTVYSQPIKYEYTQHNDVKIKEFKNETRMINGYKCFKVVYTYSEQSDDPEFEQFSKGQKLQKEFWVTPKIKSDFHPVCREKIILEKYYPLEIIEYSEAIKELKTIYKLELLAINP